MKNLISYTYYRIYLVFSSSVNSILASIFSILLLSFFYLINIISLYALLVKLKVINDLISARNFQLIYIGLALLNYFIIIYSAKEDKEKNQYLLETKKVRKRKGLFVCFYIIFTFLIYFLVALIK